jgi:hypothetical protein
MSENFHVNMSSSGSVVLEKIYLKKTIPKNVQKCISKVRLSSQNLLSRHKNVLHENKDFAKHVSLFKIEYEEGHKSTAHFSF